MGKWKIALVSASNDYGGGQLYKEVSRAQSELSQQIQKMKMCCLMICNAGEDLTTCTSLAKLYIKMEVAG